MLLPVMGGNGFKREGFCLNEKHELAFSCLTAYVNAM